ncbi:hypothetical protein [Mangrovactinospora gilvigrisea]|uniref:hypothetical protein n=1 Tax=Mangrovactinospora gilvigrisea TaxID=1428644 RepID=UPI001FEC68DD|nr:hypothetical protein [Mangrovactinospora gilvigrisea]
MTRHGKVIAIVLPGDGPADRYADLVASGRIRLGTATSGDDAPLPEYALPPDAPDPVELLLAERDEDAP